MKLQEREGKPKPYNFLKFLVILFSQKGIVWSLTIPRLEQAISYYALRRLIGKSILKTI